MNELSGFTQIDKTFHSSSNLLKVILILHKMALETSWETPNRKSSNENPAIFTIFCFFTRTERDFRDMAVGMHHGRGLQRLLSSSLFSVITLRQTVWLVQAETVHFD
jgi:hypothetical protein